MRNVYLSFLGTNDYIPCTYLKSEMPPVENVRFVQEATLELLCREWSPSDRGFIFVTTDAEKRNWNDNGFEKSLEEEDIREGLDTRIGGLRLPFPVEKVPIPEGFTETQIWDIFQTIFDRLEPEDRTFFDITHALRSIPTLAIVVLNYARVLKNISIAGIYYGAFEALGPIQEVKKMPLEKRRVEVLDLTALESLLAWSGAIDGFLKTGSAEQIRVLAGQEFGHIRKTNEGLRKTAASLEKLAKSIAEFADAVSTCRGPKIPSMAAQVRTNLVRAQKILEETENVGTGRAFRPLFDRVRDEIRVFPEARFNGGIEAARWCLDHRLIQQGYTILQETLASCIKEQFQEEAVQKLAITAVRLYSTKTPPEEWKGEAGKPENKLIMDRLFKFFEGNKPLVDLLQSLPQERNDLNHAGYVKDPKDSKHFFSKLEVYIKKAEDILRSRSASCELITPHVRR